MTINIFEVVNNALASIEPAIPFAADTFIGSLPDTYLTYFLISSPPEQSADDVETERSYRIQISFWGRTGIAGLPTAIVDAAMIAAGFIPSNFRQLPRDQASQHFGLAKDYIYLD